MHYRALYWGGLLLLLGGCSSPPAPAVSPPQPQNTVVNAVEERARLVAQAQIRADDPQALLKIARWDSEHGNLSGALEGFRAVYQKFPQSGDAAHDFGTLLLSIGRAKDALKPLQDAARLQPQNVETLVNAGIACLQNEQYEEARHFVQLATAADPKAASPYLLLARIATNKGTAEEAQKAVQNYLQRTDKPGPGYYLQARMFYREKKGAEAEASAKKALETDANSADYWAILGRVYCELQADTKRKEGIDCFEKALTLKPKNAEIHEALGAAYAKLERWDKAVEHLRSALEVASDTGPILYQLGQALNRSGKEEEGRQYLAQFTAYQNYKREFLRLKHKINTNPKDRTARYALITLCLQNEQYTAAAALLEEAERTLGTDATLQSLRERIPKRQ